MSREPRNYEIGHGRPPVQHQFPKGRSGNPNGRPRKLKPLSDVVSEVLYKQIPYREGSKTKRDPAIFVLLNKLLLRALKDDSKAIDQIIKLIQTHTIRLPDVSNDPRNPTQYDYTLQVRQKLDSLITRVNANKDDAS